MRRQLRSPLAKRIAGYLQVLTQALAYQLHHHRILSLESRLQAASRLHQHVAWSHGRRR